MSTGDLPVFGVLKDPVEKSVWGDIGYRDDPARMFGLDSLRMAFPLAAPGRHAGKGDFGAQWLARVFPCQRQRRFVEAWAELHQAELLNDWQLLQAGQRPVPIAPL